MLGCDGYRCLWVYEYFSITKTRMIIPLEGLAGLPSVYSIPTWAAKTVHAPFLLQRFLGMV
jgi:hypothetical protein